MSLHFSRNLYFGAALSTSLLFVLASCQDEDFGHAADEIKYAKNFTEIYGEIPADKSWDLSTYGYHYETDPKATRSGGDANLLDLKSENDDRVPFELAHFVKKGWWEVPKKSLEWLEKALVEGKDNRYLGSNFILQLPSNDFAIIPIYQGRSGINNELEIKINGYNIKKIWGRTEDILVNDRTLTAEQAKSLPDAASITSDNIVDGNNVWDSENRKYVTDNKWHTVGYYNGVAHPSTPDYDEVYGRGVNKAASGEPEFYVYPKYPNYTDEAHRIMTKPIYFRKDKISSGNPFMYLSLHNTGKQVIKVENGENKIWDTNIWVEKGANVWTTVGNRLTSINPEKRMLALNIPSANRPSPADLPNIHEGATQSPSQVLVIACEDADGPSTDNDINDVVFMIVGYPNAPTVIPTNEIVKKRYMCEDLGATDDFDFNDIVVDVTQEKKYELVTEPLGKEGDSFNDIQNPGTATGVEISEMLEIPESTKQWAKITHVCGTLPIQVQVGNYMFPKIEDPTDQLRTRDALKGDGELLSATKATRAAGEKIGWNPNEEKVIGDNSWEPNNNNIKVYVDWSKSVAPPVKNRVAGKVNNPYPETNSNFADFANGNKVVVNFPKPGEVPYIIATDQDVPWMLERQNIPDEWVTTGDITARNGNQADPGYGMYMENYNAGGRMEVAIWSGRVTGMASTTGVVLAPGSAEVLGIAAAGDGYTDLDHLAEGTKNPESHWYKILKVYTEPLASGQLGAIGLRMDDGSGNWIPLTTAQPDAYYQGTRENSSYGYGVDGLYCTEIYLTDEQYNLIVGSDSGRNGKGLIVTSETNGLVIRKISMDRDPEWNGQKGFIVNISKPENGSIKSSNHRERRANISDNMSDSEKNTELSRVSVPYDLTRYKAGDSFTLTAVGSKGYALKNWIVDGNSAGSENPKRFTCIDNTDARNRTISAVFEEVADPALYFPGRKTSVDLTIARGSTYSLVATSLNWSNKVEFYGHDASIVTLSTENRVVSEQLKHVVDIEGNAVGTTSFVIYLKDGYTGDTRFGVSDELKVNVSVVEKPVADVVLNADKFHKWDKYDDPTCVITGTGVIAESLNTTVQSHESETWCTTVLGSTYNDSYEYADLNRSNYLVITLAEGSGLPRFFFNKYANGETDEYRKNTMAVDFRADNRTYVSFAQNSDGTTTYWVDLKKVRADHGYCSNLNAITTDYGSKNDGVLTRSKANIISAYVDYYECPAESSNKITVSAVNGSATANGETSVNVTPGNTVRLLATANAIPDDEIANHKYEFDGWYNGSTKLSGNEDYTFTPSASMNIEARYTSLWRFRSNIIGSGYVNVHYKDQWNGMNELFIPVGETVEITAVGQNNNEFITWGWTDQNPRNVTVEEGATKNNPTATFGEVVTSEARAIEYWSNSDKSNQNYTVSLNDLKAELFKNGKKSLCIKLDSRVKAMNLQLGWENQIKTNIAVTNGVAKIEFDSDEINAITSSNSDLFLHIIDPTTTSENLQNAQITKILRY